MKDGIENKVIAITGASIGIGKATAELLAAQGAKVVLGARRPQGIATYLNVSQRYLSDMLKALTGKTTQ